ncbi:MAG TPA: hypothetical protein P5536_08415 [Methanoregulaceae archaeon]|nr:MAG: hypothetical protein IPI71_00425 [Methanolinea sp.]HON82189.1 hypothetical protein [Methanoregulaceae archaeon]HRT16075.1 hypothetical protein [Methanoregulaceae archaeon]HRU31581.1 hypothetical protein [Methanoregulaceae archaeon]
MGREYIARFPAYRSGFTGTTVITGSQECGLIVLEVVDPGQPYRAG